MTLEVAKFLARPGAAQLLRLQTLFFACGCGLARTTQSLTTKVHNHALRSRSKCDLIFIFVHQKRILSSGATCLIHGCLTCLSQRALPLSHSLFLLRHKNTHTKVTPRSLQAGASYPTRPSNPLGFLALGRRQLLIATLLFDPSLC